MNLGETSNVSIEEINAEEAFTILREKFEIDSDLSDEDARKILLVRTELYKRSFSMFIPITFA